MPPKGRGRKKAEAAKDVVVANGTEEISENSLTTKAADATFVKQSSEELDEIFDSIINDEKSSVSKDDSVLSEESEELKQEHSKEEKKKDILEEGTSEQANNEGHIDNNLKTDNEVFDESSAPTKRGRKAKAKPSGKSGKKVPEKLHSEALSVPKMSDEITEEMAEAESVEKNTNMEGDKQSIFEAPEEKSIPSKRGRKPGVKAVIKSQSNKDDEISNKEEVQDHLPSKRGRKKLDSNPEDLVGAERKDSSEEAIEQKEDLPELKETRSRRGAKKEPAASKSADVPVRANKKRGARAGSEDRVKRSKSEQDLFEENKQVQVVLTRDQEIDSIAIQNASEKESSKQTRGRGKRAAKISSIDEPEKPAKMTKTTATSNKKDKIPDISNFDFDNESVTKSGKKWNFKISTWNINGLRAWVEKDGLSYLSKEDPDILCLQETKCADDKIPDEVGKKNGYHCYWLSGDKDGYSGVGLLSKIEPINVTYGIGIKEHDEEGRVITAEYEDFFLVASYVPNAGRGLVRLKYRMEWDKEFSSYLIKLEEKKPVVLCGDLNVAHEEIDLANPKTNKKNAGFTKEEREGFSNLLSKGFVDTFRDLYPDTKSAYTFWTYMMNSRAKNIGWRLDYFLVSKSFMDKVSDNVIRKDVMGSDHCPITLFLAI